MNRKKIGKNNYSCLGLLRLVVVIIGLSGRRVQQYIELLAFYGAELCGALAHARIVQS